MCEAHHKCDWVLGHSEPHWCPSATPREGGRPLRIPESQMTKIIVICPPRLEKYFNIDLYGLAKNYLEIYLGTNNEKCKLSTIVAEYLN